MSEQPNQPPTPAQTIPGPDDAPVLFAELKFTATAGGISATVIRHGDVNPVALGELLQRTGLELVMGNGIHFGCIHEGGPDAHA
jgi:hypothetical protein